MLTPNASETKQLSETKSLLCGTNFSDFVYKEDHSQKQQTAKMCLSNAPIVREFIATSAAVAALEQTTLLPFVINTTTTIHQWIQPQPVIIDDVIMVDNNPTTAAEDPFSSWTFSPQQQQQHDVDDMDMGNWDPAEDNITDDDRENERRLSVYRGLQRPHNDEDWHMIFEHCTAGLSDITGLVYEFHEWQDAWDFSSSSENDDDVDF